ncbi:HlyD family secretion protein [Vibrio sp. SS-MA-C1-2]|uniref:HlyD family secretion protein n=1 Tax=Vibrio sp. SS-MA-C1-2 TaxID=2908646 RepID=UPI001F442F65|nr:HlyD family secretion protein [Vibrio sp. SS-MA-C1-2]UJF19897.1 HlyD family secretion protein [Vibrio sp. SS-MA-C1-2]
MKKLMPFIFPVILISTSVFVGNQAINKYMNSPWTRDGRIQAEITQVTPLISGQVIDLKIKDNQLVKKGELLLEVDPTDFQLIVNEKEQELESSQIALNVALDDYRRDTGAKKFITNKQLTIDKFNIQSAKVSLNLAKNKLDTAKLNLSRTKIYAKSDGYITNLSLRSGNYIHAGTPIFALVEEHSFYAIGYFSESQMNRIHIGDQAVISLMSGNSEIKAKVEGFGRAISNASANNSGLVASINPTVPWIRLSQRVPVRLTFNAIDKTIPIIAGSTVSVVIKEDNQ